MITLKLWHWKLFALIVMMGIFTSRFIMTRKGRVLLETLESITSKIFSY